MHQNVDLETMRSSLLDEEDRLLSLPRRSDEYRLRLSKVRRAIMRIRNGYYGECLAARCQQNILPARLVMDPAVEYCSDGCQHRVAVERPRWSMAFA